MGKMKLFDDNGGSSDDDDLSKIEINHEYAKRLEHNKKREELQRYEELKKQGRINDESSDEEDEDGDDEELNKLDPKFFDALIKIKKKDPILNDKDAKLFDSDESDREEKVAKRKKEKKPMYLKDVVSKQLIETGPEFDDDDEEIEKVKTYSDEQEELKREFLKAVEEEENDDDDDEIFKVKDDGNAEDGEDGGEEEIAEKLDVIFGEDGKLDEDNKFLKDYFMNKMWIDDNEKKKKSKDVSDEEIEYSEDEEEIEKQEDYEREFNFRFEENAGDRVMGHARKVEGSVRKVHNARKSQRERKEERMVQAEFERKEELKRLKNLKRKEINEKLDKIRKVAGVGSDEDIALDVDDLEKDFDPEEHDRKMKEAYDDGYYGAQDVDPTFGSDEDEDEDGVEKPDFDKEDELLGLPKGWDEVEETSDVEMNSGGDGEDGDEELQEGKRKRKRKVGELEKAKTQMMDEYHKLDYEGVVAGMKTRFRYKPVPAKRFGLSTAELLLVDEKELNQYVPLKKLAPYQQEGWKEPRVKILELKKKIKGSGFGETSKSSKKHKKSQSNGEGANKGVEIVEDDKSLPEDSNDEATLSSSKRRHSMKEPKPTLETSKSSKKRKKSRSNGEAATEVVEKVEDEKSLAKESNDETTLSRKAKRRRKMKEFKPNQSRLQAYGLI